MLQASQKVLLGSSSKSSAEPLAGLWLPSLALPPPPPTLPLPPSPSEEDSIPSFPAVVSVFPSTTLLDSVEPPQAAGSESDGEAEAALLAAPPWGEAEGPCALLEGAETASLIGPGAEIAPSPWCLLEQYSLLCA